MHLESFRYTQFSWIFVCKLCIQLALVAASSRTYYVLPRISGSHHRLAKRRATPAVQVQLQPAECSETHRQNPSNCHGFSLFVTRKSIWKPGVPSHGLPCLKCCKLQELSDPFWLRSASPLEHFVSKTGGRKVVILPRSPAKRSSYHVQHPRIAALGTS